MVSKSQRAWSNSAGLPPPPPLLLGIFTECMMEKRFAMDVSGSWSLSSDEETASSSSPSTSSSSVSLPAEYGSLQPGQFPAAATQSA